MPDTSPGDRVFFATSGYPADYPLLGGFSAFSRLPTIAAEWDGTTFFNNAPSNSPTSFTRVVGVGTSHPIAMSLRQLVAFYYRPRKLRIVGTIGINGPDGQPMRPVAYLNLYPEVSSEKELIASSVFFGRYFSGSWSLINEEIPVSNNFRLSAFVLDQNAIYFAQVSPQEFVHVDPDASVFYPQIRVAFAVLTGGDVQIFGASYQADPAMNAEPYESNHTPSIQSALDFRLEFNQTTPLWLGENGSNTFDIPWFWRRDYSITSDPFATGSLTMSVDDTDFDIGGGVSGSGSPDAWWPYRGSDGDPIYNEATGEPLPGRTPLS